MGIERRFLEEEVAIMSVHSSRPRAQLVAAMEEVFPYADDEIQGLTVDCIRKLKELNEEEYNELRGYLEHPSTF